MSNQDKPVPTTISTPFLLTSTIEKYFNFAYFVFVCPYSIQYDAKTNTFFLNSSRYRKVFVAFLHITVTYISFSQELVAVLSSSSKSTLEAMLAAISLVIWTVYSMSVVHCVWFQRGNLLKFLSHLQSVCSVLQNNGIPPTGYKMSWIVSTTLLIITFFWFVLNTIIWTYGIQDLNLSCSGMKIAFMDRPQAVYFGYQNYTDSIKGGYPWHAYVSSITYLIIGAMSNAIQLFGFALPMGISITFWFIVRSFVNHVKVADRNRKELKLMMEIMNELCLALDSCGDTVGFLYGVLCLGHIPTHAIHLPRFIGSEYIGAKLMILCFTLNNLSCVLLAADVHSMITSITPWIQNFYFNENTVITTKPKFDVSSDDDNLHYWINIMVQQINGNKIGLSGKSFIVTYGVLGNVFSVVVTYAIIIIQFKSIA